MPLAWPVSVPPVIVRLHPHAFFSAMAPSTVASRRPSYEVHVDLFLSVQLPLDRELMPAFSRRDWASCWVSALMAAAETMATSRVENWAWLVCRYRALG